MTIDSDTLQISDPKKSRLPQISDHRDLWDLEFSDPK